MRTGALELLGTRAPAGTVMTKFAGISLDMRPANERRRYNITTSLIGWAHT